MIHKSQLMFSQKAFLWLGLGRQLPNFRFHWGLSRPNVPCSIPSTYFTIPQVNVTWFIIITGNYVCAMELGGISLHGS